MSKTQTIHIALNVLIISVITTIGLTLYINKLAPEYSVEALKSAKITHLQNAYINTDSELFGVTKNRQQFKYTVPDDFKLNPSGNISVYTFKQNFGRDVALTKAEYESTWKQYQKLEQEQKPFLILRKYSIVIWVISLVVFIGALIGYKPEDTNIETINPTDSKEKLS